MVQQSAAAPHLAHPTLTLSSAWLGTEVNGATPIHTSILWISPRSLRDGVQVLEIFGGIGLGLLRAALAAGCTIRCYTYADRDSISRHIAREVLLRLQLQYLNQLPHAAIPSFKKRLPQEISLLNTLFLKELVV